MRARLGGRAESDAGVGELVRFAPAPGMDLVGVLLFASGDEARVLVDGGAVRRTRRAMLSPLGSNAPAELVAIAADARTFGALHEGDRVRWDDAKLGAREGRLVEKCRYGALVAADDGTHAAVGFRRIRPATRHDGAAS